MQLDGTDECMLMIESNYMKTLMLDTIDKIESLADPDNILTVIKDGEILKHKPIF